ncbi:XkdX family protein [Cytobacillus oceanisediminis]|nr:XkdX family protein [Cytobacillus oceanisediminis]
MDWYSFALSDWEVYGDPSRIAIYVQFNKITAEQYENITEEPYTA